MILLHINIDVVWSWWHSCGKSMCKQGPRNCGEYRREVCTVCCSYCVH